MVNFYERAITPACHQALTHLPRPCFIEDFYLAGGTALALQIGHRISTDLDWFRTTRTLPAPEREAICAALSMPGLFEVVSEQDRMLFTRLFRTDVSVIYQHHALLKPTVSYQGVPLASPTDIGGLTGQIAQ